MGRLCADIGADRGCLALTTAAIYGRSAALSALQQQGRTDANLKVALLQAVLERTRALPLLLSRDRDVEDALTQSGQEKKDALSGKLEDLVKGTNAAVIYVVNADGIAVSASNWHGGVLSFVGNDYTFRSYFTRGMREGMAEHFALGSVSKAPRALYLAPYRACIGSAWRRCRQDGVRSAGKRWSDTQRPALRGRSEQRGVLITSVPSWRFMTIGSACCR